MLLILNLQLILNIWYFPERQLFATIPNPSILHSLFHGFELIIQLLLIFIHTFCILRKGAKFQYKLIWIMILLYFHSFNLAHIFLYNNFNITAFIDELSGFNFIAIEKLFLSGCWIRTIGHYKVIQNLIEIIHWHCNITRHLFAVWEFKISLIECKGTWKCEHAHYFSN